jgi:hypothetical protein
MENQGGRSCQLRLFMGLPLQFNAVPTNGRCEAMAAFEIHQGHHRNVSLDGIRFLRVYSWPASISEGNGTRLMIIEGQASASQRQALLALDGGKQGGPYFEIFASVCPNVLDPIFAPPEIITDREHRRAKVVVPNMLESRVEPILNPVTGEEHRARIVLPNGFEYKEAEMGNTISFQVKAPQELAMRHQNTYAQLNAFDWSN